MVSNETVLVSNEMVSNETVFMINFKSVIKLWFIFFSHPTGKRRCRAVARVPSNFSLVTALASGPIRENYGGQDKESALGFLREKSQNKTGRTPILDTKSRSQSCRQSKKKTPETPGINHVHSLALSLSQAKLIFDLLVRTWNIFILHLPEPTGPGNFLLIVDGLQTFDVLPSSTGDSSTHRGRTADLLMCCPAGAPNFLRSIDASAIFLVGTHMIAELSSLDGTLFFFSLVVFFVCVCCVFERGGVIGGQNFPILELAPETAWNLFASPRTGCGEIPFGGVRQESSLNP
ncbi:integrase_H2C2 domain-containing protein [Trichonephila clavipes]|nr:integrase_H2C2 domain-containing protein [Trichonephila clavipes]